MGRAPCCDKASVKKGPWSPEEDKQLKEYIEKHGTGGNWIALPHRAGLRRCGKSCRLRWLNYLRPNIKHGDFSDDEDRIICSLFASIGSRWSIIAAQLPGRTDNDIKNYWNTKLKKKLLGLPPTYRKPNHHHHHHHHQQQKHHHHHHQQFFPSSCYSFEAAAPLMIPSSSPPSSSVAADLEGIPLPFPFDHFINPNFMAAASPQAPKQEISSGNLITFGGDQQQQMSCDSISSREHLSFGDCFHGGLLMENAEKLIHGYDISNTNNNLLEENAAAAAAAMDMSSLYRSIERAMYHSC